MAKKIARKIVERKLDDLDSKMGRIAIAPKDLNATDRQLFEEVATKFATKEYPRRGIKKAAKWLKENTALTCSLEHIGHCIRQFEQEYSNGQE